MKAQYITSYGRAGRSPSAVHRQYKKILKRFREDSRFSKGWEKESRSIMSMIKGRPHK